MEYPKIVKLDDPKLKKLIESKKALILEGRGVAGQIDLITESLAATNAKLVEAESAVDVKDLVLEAEEHIKKLEELKLVIFDRIKVNTPQELRDQYDQLEKQKAEKEKELNKIGHQVQKVKDKIIPIVQKLGKPHLEDEFEDFETTDLDESGNPILTIFNHLEDWKKTFRSTK